MSDSNRKRFFHKILEWFLSIGGGLILTVICALFLNFIFKDPANQGRDAYTYYTELHWRTVFAFGILSSMWAQLSVGLYFILGDYYKAISNNRFVAFLSYCFMPIMLVLAIATLYSVDNFDQHILFTIGFMSIAALWDALIVIFARPNANEKRKFDLFRQHCKDLLFHVDGLPLFVILLWFLFLRNMDLREFSFLDDIAKSFSGNLKDITISLDFLKNQIPFDKQYTMKEPLMAGVIGFHMIVTVFALSIQIIMWIQKYYKNTPTNSNTEPADSYTTQS